MHRSVPHVHAVDANADLVVALGAGEKGDEA